MMARLASVEVTGEDGAPLAANIDVVKSLSKLPGMRRMMEQVQTEASRIIEQPAEVIEMVPDDAEKAPAALLEGGTGETSSEPVETPQEPDSNRPK
jgi:CTP:molybdopterin cytidylyltransferase MocA